jgi:steroid delta-isomerase-like uncharacterized protein
MSAETETNKSTVRRLTNMINSRELSSLDECLEENYVYESTSGEKTEGLGQVRDLLGSYFQAFSDFEISIEAMFAEGDQVCVIYRQTGKHTGEFLGIEPSGNRMDLAICSVGQFKNGKLVHQQDFVDTLDLLKQVGVVSRDFPEEAAWR